MQNHLNYPEILNESMKYLVREILTRVQKHGFYGDHYLYITFDTKSKNVIISERVKKIYPSEITIILQYQYDNLKVHKDKFSVELSFNGIRESITIPFNAIITLVDPTANFSITLKSSNSSDESSLDDEFLSILQNDYEDSFYFPSLNDKKKISKTTSEIKISKDKKDSKDKTMSKKDNIINIEDYRKKIADKNKKDKDKDN